MQGTATKGVHGFQKFEFEHWKSLQAILVTVVIRVEARNEVLTTYKSNQETILLRLCLESRNTKNTVI